MKNLVVLAVLTLCASSHAAKQRTNIESETLHVDGDFIVQNSEVKTKIKAEDSELKFLKNELNNVKGLKTGYKKKAKVYNKLSEESEQLKDQFEGYIENRVDYESSIAGYNTLVECLKSGKAQDCYKKISKRSNRNRNRNSNNNVNVNENENDVDVNVDIDTDSVSASNNTETAPRRSGGYNAAYSDSIELRQAAPKKDTSVVIINNGSKKRRRKGNKIFRFVKEVDYRIAQRQPELVECYKRGGLNEEGVLKVVLKIAPNGALHHLGFKDTRDINDRRIIRCVSRVLYSINYPRTPNRKMTAISKPFVFNTI